MRLTLQAKVIEEACRSPLLRLNGCLWHKIWQIIFWRRIKPPVGFPIVFAKFWWLRSAEGYRPRKTPSLLSDTFAPTASGHVTRTGA